MEHIRAFLRAFTPRRRAAYFIGTILLAYGITLNTRTNLGVAPILSVAFNISELLGIPFSLMSFFYYCFLILVQLVLLRSRFDQIQWFQLVASFLTSAFIAVFSAVIPAAASVPLRIIYLPAAILLTGLGIILSVGARFVPNPGDGTAYAISICTGRSLGLSKNILDISSFLIALALGLVFRGRIMGVGIGTIVTMLLTGRVVALLQKPVLRLAGLNEEK